VFESINEKYSLSNSILLSLLKQRSKSSQSDESLAHGLQSGISDDKGLLIGRAITKYRSKCALEIGFANGFSSLFILDALDQKGGGTLLSLDPFQMSDWEGRGVERVNAAKFLSKHEFLERSAWEALPELIEAGRQFDFCLIDGSHSFDNAFIDFYLVDKLLDKGALLAFDDVGWSGVERVVHYVVTNRDYSIIDSLSCGQVDRRRLLKPIKTLCERIARTHRSPGRESRLLLEKVNDSSFLILMKTSHRSQEQSFKYF